MSISKEYPGLVLPPRPEAPLHGECCGRGCEHCV
ncbi:MAG: oxidoreductase-like domain-containing protein, partial [Gammaproteobacteria bacterium]